MAPRPTHPTASQVHPQRDPWAGDDEVGEGDLYDGSLVVGLKAHRALQLVRRPAARPAAEHVHHRVQAHQQVPRDATVARRVHIVWKVNARTYITHTHARTSN